MSGCGVWGWAQTLNPAGKNEGSCKLFYFAQLKGLSPAETVALFGQYAAEVRTRCGICIRTRCGTRRGTLCVTR